MTKKEVEEFLNKPTEVPGKPFRADLCDIHKEMEKITQFMENIGCDTGTFFKEDGKWQFTMYNSKTK